MVLPVGHWMQDSCGPGFFLVGQLLDFDLFELIQYHFCQQRIDFGGLGLIDEWAARLEPVIDPMARPIGGRRHAFLGKVGVLANHALGELEATADENVHV
jgi:hypothetical protein